MHSHLLDYRYTIRSVDSSPTGITRMVCYSDEYPDIQVMVQTTKTLDTDALAERLDAPENITIAELLDFIHA